MLKRPPLRPARRALGLGLLVGLTLAGAGAVQAVGADVTTAAPQIELKLDLSYQTGNDTYRTQPTLRIAAGKRATVMLNGTPDKPSPGQVAIDIEARDLGDDKIEVRTELKKGLPLATIAKPRLITNNGVRALIEQGHKNPTETEHHLSLAITPTLLTQRP